MIFLCMDANFRLKNQVVSNYSQDPGLGIGWAYLVPRIPYRNYILSHTNDTDASTQPVKNLMSTYLHFTVTD